MFPTQAIIDQLAALLAADATTIDNAVLCKVALVKAPFTPGPFLLPADLTLSDFGGSTPKALGAVPGPLFKDPTTGQWIIQLDEPAGGWHWQTTGAALLPQTVYGFALFNNGLTILYGTELLPTPIVLTGFPQGFDVPDVRFTLNQSPLT